MAGQSFWGAVLDKMNNKRYGQVLLVIGITLLAIVPAILESHSLLFHALGFLFVLGGMSLLGRHDARTSPSVPDASASARWPGGTAWIVGVGSVAAAAVAYTLLYKDAATGYHQVWPVYLFAAVGLVCAAAWAYIAAKRWNR